MTSTTTGKATATSGKATARVRAALAALETVDRPEIWITLRGTDELLAEAAAIAEGLRQRIASERCDALTITASLGVCISGGTANSLQAACAERGGNAVVGIDLDYEVIGDTGSMLMVSASGTAVKV